MKGRCKMAKRREEAVILGRKLKELRAKTGLSQDALGEQLGITGAAWRLYELGMRIPNDKIKKKIATYFDKTVDELFFE